MATENLNEEVEQQKPVETPVENETGTDQQSQSVEQSNEHPEDKPAEDDWKNSEVFSETEKMSHGFRKRIEKIQSKHQTEMEELKNSYEARIKALEERTAPKPEVKNRESFSDDESYIAYLTQQQIEKDRADQQAKSDEQRNKEDEERKAREAEEAEVKALQDKFLKNTHDSFDGESEKAFMAKLQYATSKGFDDVLKANPVAAEYLLGHKMGPRTLAHILDHTEEFKTVFCNPEMTQMEQFYELKQIENRVLEEGRQRAAEQVEEPAKPAKPTYKLGKPGSQGAITNGANTLDDPIARRDWLRKLGVC